MEHLKYMHNFYELPGFGWGGLEGKVIIYKPTLVKQMSGKKTNKKKKKVLSNCMDVSLDILL